MAQLCQGKGRGIGTSTPYGYRSAWADVARWADEQRIDPLAWKNRLLALFDGARVEAGEMLTWAERIQVPILHNHVLLRVVEELVADGALEYARALAKQLRPVPSLHGDSQCQGCRVLLRHFANQGDVDGFFMVWPRCAARQERHEIKACKRRLVEAVSTRQGWEAAVAPCKDRRLGGSCYGAALRSLAEAGACETSQQVFHERPDLRQPERQMESWLLVRAYAVAAGQGRQDIKEFEDLFERVSALDPKVKVGKGKPRDFLFCELGRVPPDLAWRKRCNTLTKNPALRWKLEG